MAITNLKTRYKNTQRRETNSATASLPSLLTEAYRAEPKEVVLTATEYTMLTLPANVMVTGIRYLVSEAYTNATSAAALVKLGATTLDAAINLKTVGASNSATTAPIWVTAPTDLTITPTLVGAATDDEAGIFKVLIEYNDYNRDTGSYLA